MTAEKLALARSLNGGAAGLKEQEKSGMDETDTKL